MSTEVEVHRQEHRITVRERNSINGITILEKKNVVESRPEKRIEIITVGTQGPPGPPGPPGSGIDGEQVSAATILLAHRAVVLNSVGKAEYASRTNPAHRGRVAGITMNSAAAPDAQVNLKTLGIIDEPGWSWTPGGKIFLDINGVMTQTRPTSGFSQELGYAITPTSMLVRIFLAVGLGG